MEKFRRFNREGVCGNNECDGPGADIFIKKNIDQLLIQNQEIDTVVLGCTHYPLLLNKIRQFLPSNISIISQGEIVAESLKDYLQRHPEIDNKCTKNSSYSFLTTDSPESFNKKATKFLGQKVKSSKLTINTASFD